MKKNGIIVMMVLLLTGCGQGHLNQEINNREEVVMTEDKQMEEEMQNTPQEQNTAQKQNAAEELNSLLQDVETLDGKTLMWDGEKAAIVEDPNTSEGESCIQDYEAEGLISFSYPEDYQQVEKDEQNPDHCHFSGSDTEILTEQIDYEEEVGQFDADENFRACDKLWIREDRKSRFKNHKTYIGVREFDGVKKAGFVFLFESASTDRSYKIEVYGLGDVLEVRLVAYGVVNTFSVLTD